MIVRDGGSSDPAALPPVASPSIDEIADAYDAAAAARGRNGNEVTGALSIYLTFDDWALEILTPGERAVYEVHRRGPEGRKLGAIFGREQLPRVLWGFVVRWLAQDMLLHLRQSPGLLPELERFAGWLAEEGHVDPGPAAEIVRLARVLRGKLLRAERAKRRLARVCRRRVPPWDVFGEATHTCFEVVRIEPGRLWMRPRYQDRALYGPVKVPVRASAMLEVGWDLWCTLLAEGGRWQLDRVGQVVPANPLGAPRVG